MKTPMQEVYENFNLMSDRDFKAWLLNTDLLEKEKEFIQKVYNNAKATGEMDEAVITFKTKEK